MKNVSIGTWVTISNQTVVEIISECDFQWICIDFEHTSLSYSEIKAMIQFIHSKNKEVFVRIGENNKLIIKKVLDLNADGLIIPMVNSKKDSENAVSASFYPPKGNRGVGLYKAQKYGFGFEDYLLKMNKLKIIAQIEHYKAIDNLDEIIQTNGISGTLIGPYDLSGSLGYPGDWKNNKVKEYLKKYLKKAKKYNKLIGCHLIEPDNNLLKIKIEEGYNFIAFSLDTLFLGTKIRDELKKIK